MSLNDFFAGGVYLRPMGLPDCFPMPGLPHGCKPPPPPQLTMQHPCGAGPPQKPRSMAAVSPLHQVSVPSQASHLAAAYESPSAAMNAFGPAVSAANRTSSFAAALRKLAKQAGDPIVGDKDLTQISPVSSPVLAQRSLTPKRNGGNVSGQPSMYLSSGGVNNNAHQVTSSYPSGSPPVVTIAPSRPHQAHASDSRKLQVMDLSGLAQGKASSGLTNGHMSDSLSLKLDSGNKGSSRVNASDKWEDHHVSKSMTTSSGSSQSRPHATIAPLPRPDDSLTSSRGFQPYRSVDDIRTSLPHHLSPFEHHPPSAYPYAPAFLPPPHMAHPAYRFEDPLFLDRYGLLRSPVMPFPGQSGMMASPAAFYPQSRYDLLAQSLSLTTAANNSILHHERLKIEEERRLREKETELDQSRKREQERREKEQKEKEHREKEKEIKRERSHREKVEKNNAANNDQQHGDHGNRSTSHSQSQSKRTEHSVPRNDSVGHPAATAITNGHRPPSSPVNNSSTPLNLVVHPNPEQPRKEAELWVPWQHHHPPANPHPNNQAKDNHEDGANGAVPYRHSTLVVPENYRVHVTKENNSPEKFQPPYNIPFYGDKKHSNSESNHLESEPKKHVHHNNGNTKKFDSLHHHIAELSKKDVNNVNSNEWKHEKLQKACTNNHRKSVNEFKKLRDENHQRKPHHHPVINGVVKPSVFYQTSTLDEGMHARLLETEKCRLSEYNHHLSIKNATLNQTSDKMPLPPTLMPNNHQLNGHDVFTQKMYMDHNHAAMSALKPPVDTTPVRSKLDLEAENSKKRGTTDNDGEETSLTDFLIVTKGPPFKLDTSPNKLKFMKIIGLTSHLKRKKIELDIYLKRRKLLHEGEFVKLTVQSEEKTDVSKSLWERSHSMDRLSEKLRLEAKSDKSDFFRSLGLKPLTLAMKDEQARLSKTFMDERKRREQRLKDKSNKKSNKQSTVETKEEKENLESKRNLTGEKSKSNVKPNAADTLSSQNISTPSKQVPYTHAPELEESTIEKRDESQPTRNDKVSKMHNINSKRRAKYSFKRGHSLKCEWKPPVLTLMTPNNHFKDGAAIIKTEIKTDFNNHISTGTQVDLSLTSKNSLDKKDKNQKSFHWPGLDIIMEAYYRHNKEQLQEKDVIQERCNRLKVQQEDLKKEASTLNKSMTELLKLKRELDDKRSQHEKAIERLTQCMQIGR